MKLRLITLTFIIICLFLGALVFLKGGPVPGDKEADNEVIAWREDFKAGPGKGPFPVPDNWRLKKKPGTPSAVFSIEKSKEDDDSYLHMEADKASASLVTRIDGISLGKESFLKWRWKVEKLPEGADGRHKDKDDQAIGIYVGTGSLLNNKSVSYRWDTDTPKGAEGDCVYGAGTVKVKWITLRNKEDAGGGQWFIEERNVAEDFKDAWGFYPKNIYLSMSCNSQYTGTVAIADIDWVELGVPSSGEEPLEGEKE